MMNLSDLLMVETKNRVQAEAEAAGRKNTAIEACRAEMSRALALLDGWDITQSEAIYTRNEGQTLEYVQWTIDSPTFGRFYLAGMMTDKGPAVVWRNFDRYSNHHPKSRVEVRADSASSPAEVGKFFADLQDEQLEAKAKEARYVAEQREQERKRRVSRLTEELLNTSVTYDRFPSDELAAEIISELALLVSAERLVEIRTQWAAKSIKRREWLAEKAAEIEAEQARQAEYARTLAEYKEAYRRWWHETGAVWAANKDAADKLQAEYNTPFGVYKLTYTIGVLDDGEMHVEERSITCLALEPEFNISWHYELSKTGRVKRVFYNPAAVLKVSEPEQTTPLEYKYAPDISLRKWTNDDDDFFYFHPQADRAEVEAAVAAVMQAVPEEPEPPELPSYEDLKTVTGQVRYGDDNYRYNRSGY